MKDLHSSNNQNDNLKAYNKAKDFWEANSLENSEGVLKEAIDYLRKLPPLIGTGPSTTILVDFSDSKFKGKTGNFEGVFGMEYKNDMGLADIVPFFYPEHNALIEKHFPTYINHLLSVGLKRRNELDVTIIFKYLRREKYCWLSFKAFRYFSDHPKTLGCHLVEFTDISEVKDDDLAKYIIYDKQDGYIVNDVITPTGTSFEKLTRTELAVTKLIAQGLSDKEIGSKRDSALETIKNHKRNIFQKLNINKSTELVAIAYENGLNLK